GLDDLVHQVLFHERAFFDRTSHKVLLLLVLHRPAIAPDQDETIREFAFVSSLIALGNDTPRRHGMAATGGLAGSASHGMVHRVLGDGATQRPDTAMAAA